MGWLTFGFYLYIGMAVNGTNSIGGVRMVYIVLRGGRRWRTGWVMEILRCGFDIRICLDYSIMKLFLADFRKMDQAVRGVGGPYREFKWKFPGLETIFDNIYLVSVFGMVFN